MDNQLHAGYPLHYSVIQLFSYSIIGNLSSSPYFFIKLSK
jgi:hypothetical protein